MTGAKSPRFTAAEKYAYRLGVEKHRVERCVAYAVNRGALKEDVATYILDGTPHFKPVDLYDDRDGQSGDYKRLYGELVARINEAAAEGDISGQDHYWLIHGEHATEGTDHETGPEAMDRSEKEWLAEQEREVVK